MLTYRKLAREDLDIICAFPVDEEELFCVSPRFRYPLTPEQIMRVLEERFNPTVIFNEDGGQPLAYANLYDKDEEQHTCWLGNVIVSPEQRRSGVSSFLLESMIGQARKEHNIHTLKLFCHNTNTRALLFYCRHGFIPCGYKIFPGLNQDKIVGIEMFKRLG